MRIVVLWHVLLLALAASEAQDSCAELETALTACDDANAGLQTQRLCAIARRAQTAKGCQLAVVGLLGEGGQVQGGRPLSSQLTSVVGKLVKEEVGKQCGGASAGVLPACSSKVKKKSQDACKAKNLSKKDCGKYSFLECRCYLKENTQKTCHYKANSRCYDGAYTSLDGAKTDSLVMAMTTTLRIMGGIVSFACPEHDGFVTGLGKDDCCNAKAPDMGGMMCPIGKPASIRASHFECNDKKSQQYKPKCAAWQNNGKAELGDAESLGWGRRRRKKKTGQNQRRRRKGIFSGMMKQAKSVMKKGISGNFGKNALKMAMKLLPKDVRPITTLLVKTKGNVKKMLAAAPKQPAVLHAISKIAAKVRNFLLLKMKRNPCGFECFCKARALPLFSARYATTASEGTCLSHDDGVDSHLVRHFNCGTKPQKEWSTSDWIGKTQIYKWPAKLKQEAAKLADGPMCPSGKNSEECHANQMSIWEASKYWKTMVVTRRLVKTQKIVCVGHFDFLQAQCTTCCCKGGLLAGAVSSALRIQEEKDCGPWFGLMDTLFRTCMGFARVISTGDILKNC